jgi:CelD/BcsL family acetyltransferase involved in cellulose biosynthesis
MASRTPPTDAPDPAGSPAGVAEAVDLPMMIGARTLWRLRRRLVRVPLTLRQVLDQAVPELGALPAGADGFLVNSLPADLLSALAARQPGLRAFVRQRYRRSYASLDGGFDAYLSGFSAKSRSTLKRKVRKLAERSGGTLDLRCYRTPAEAEEFYWHARQVSARTYQERLLDAGLPEGEEALKAIRAEAAADAMRGWLLFLDGAPISYLYAPADGATLIYAHLGYDPAFAEFSPGTVLQFEAMRELMKEGRFGLFDFTEGEGQHKLQFGTGTVDCIDVLLVRRSLGNLLAGHALNGFDGAVAAAKRAVRRVGLERHTRALRR